MILHLAIFTWRDGVTDEQVLGLTGDLLDMAETLPEIVEYRCGPALGIRPGGDFGVAAVIDSADDLNAYLDHPLHLAVQERWMNDMVAHRIAVQLPHEPGL